MAIFFMAMGILISGTWQALRLAEFERSEAVQSRSDAMRLTWFRDSIGQTVIPTDEFIVPPFTADAQHMSGTTGLSLTHPQGGPGKYAWELQYNAARAETELRAAAGGNGGQGEKVSEKVFAWPGSQGRFRYLDEAGNWQDQWPPFGLNPGKIDLPGYNLLPQAVMLEYGADRRVLVAAIQDRTIPLPSLREILTR